jgi:hypothetical protein
VLPKGPGRRLGDLGAGQPGSEAGGHPGVTACIAAGSEVTLEESELLRIVAAALGCPLPPVAAGNEKIKGTGAYIG